MPELKIHKVLSLPAVLQPDAVYAVRSGEGFDFYISDALGQTAHPINSAAAPPGTGGRVVEMNVKTLGLAVPRNELSAGGSAWLDAIAASGAKAIRFDFYFDQIQPTQGGAYVWSSVDSIVSGARSRNLHILGVLTGIRAGSGETYNTTADRTAFSQFAAAAADRYKGTVDHWAIYNEPNLGKMTVANYSALLIATAPAIREANPNAFIVGPNIASIPDPTTGLNTNNADWMNGMYSAGANVHYDAIGFHAYSYPWWPDESEPSTGWNQMLNVVRPLMNTHEPEKKIWLTEVGHPSGPTGSGVNQWYTNAHQADALNTFVVEANKYPWIGPMFWYSWQDRAAQSSTEDFFGLRDPNGTNKPSYTNFSTAAATFPALVEPTPPVTESGARIHVGPTAPTDTTMLWVQT